MLGAVQVPADGRPVVMLADHPTTGGYPVLAVVDRPRPAAGRRRPARARRCASASYIEAGGTDNNWGYRHVRPSSLRHLHGAVPPGRGEPDAGHRARPRARSQHLDRLGWDEAWIGEHHSAGTEIIASPEIFIAAAAERTRHIKLGTGVISVAYHNPYMVAERAVLLDHMTRGRFMLGVGPGSLPTDAIMLGLDPTETRPLLEEGLDVIMRLLTTDEPVTSQTKMWNLNDARLHLRPYSDPLFDVAVPAVASPSGPRLAGKHGVGLLSIGATQAAGFDVLGLHWDVMEERAATFGTIADRAKWRLVGLMHIAETEEQAAKDVEYGIRQWFDYFQHTAAFPQMDVGERRRGAGDDRLRQRLRARARSAPPTMACEQIDRLQKQSGGFGCYMSPGPRVGQPRGDQAQLRADRPARLPRVPGPGGEHARPPRSGPAPAASTSPSAT